MLTKEEFVVLSHLRRNSRKSLTALSADLDMPAAAIYSIMNRLKNEGIIKKHYSLLDFQKLGFGVRVGLFFKTKNGRLISYLSKHPNVNSIFKLTGDYDYMVDTVFKDFTEYESFKDKFEQFNVIKVNEHYILEELKKEGMIF